MIASLIASVMLLIGAVPSLPFAHYSDVHGVTPIGPACTSVSEDVTELRTAEYRILSSRERDVFMHLGENGQVDYVYFARGTSGDNTIHVVRALSIDAARVAYPTGPCAYFTEREA